MTTSKSTPQSPQLPVENVNEALKTRWRYFRSIGGTMILSCFDSAPIEDNPYFIEIDRIEYEHLLKELES